MDYIARAKQILQMHLDKPFDVIAFEDNIRVVWCSKTLDNWKVVLVSEDTPPGYYFEITHSGAKGESYLDEYRKSAHFLYKD